MMACQQQHCHGKFDCRSKSHHHPHDQWRGGCK
jgi:hypothetical protein